MPTADLSSISGDSIFIDVLGPASLIVNVVLDVTCGKPPRRMIVYSTASEIVGNERYRLTFPTPKIRPIRAVMPVHLRDDGVSEVITVTEKFGLANLLPIEKRDLSRIVFHRASRTSDLDTLSFVLDQVYRSTENNVFERIEAAKILAYRALEAVDLAALPMCLRRIVRAADWIPQLPDEFGVAKTSRYQSTISLIFLRYLIYMFLGNASGVDRELKLIGNSTGYVKECPIAAYNLCLALLTKGYLAAKRGHKEEAREDWGQIINLFREATSTMPSSTPETFVELTISFKTATVAAFAIKDLKGKRIDEAYKLTPERIAREFSRLRTPKAHEFMAKQIEELAHSPGHL